MKINRKSFDLRKYNIKYFCSSENLNDVEYYKKIRIYKDNNFLDLTNRLFINSLCKSEYFVKNSLTYVTILKKLLGQNISEFLIRATMGRIFTGGQNIEEMANFTSEINKKGLSVVYFYSNEAIPGLEFSEKDFDENKRKFIESIEKAKLNKQNMIALKLSALGNFSALRSLSKIQLNLINIYEQIDKDKKNIIDKNNLLNYISNDKKNNNNDDLHNFYDLFFNNNSSQFIEKDYFKIKCHFFNIDQNEQKKRYTNKLYKQYFELNEIEIEQISNMIKRLEEIADIAKKSSVRILIDAEQTYVQPAIDSIADQFQQKYNDMIPLIYNTIQNYLKSSKERVLFEISKNLILKKPFGLKIVRGAYMDEEKKLSLEENRNSPICDNFQMTTEHFHTNIQNLLNNFYNNSEILIGSHNPDTIKFAIKKIDENKIDKKNGGVKFAQLLGLADHLTFSLKHEGYHAHKLIPFGETNVLIPYLLRRAHESKVNFTSTNLQRQLVKSELKTRILGK